MKLFFYSLLMILFFATVFYGDKKKRKDEYCKEGLFYQMLFNKCTPRDFLLKQNEEESI